jgi:hypothetical protein
MDLERDQFWSERQGCMADGSNQLRQPRAVDCRLTAG